ncbi:hypothetical protein [Algoriphagus sp.]|uniref:hypothetical protein n=1 Tax=Algoriphagus sp. TaxID=1872435 RepID=UPI0025E010BB|nr:hypothetical protein [Algoriphagus sp.]
MTIQINSNYLEKYAEEYATIVCDGFFSSKQYITGQDIIQLTSSTQVNFFIIKRLFELWQEELSKLKSNPFFDYRDIAVHEALTQFMNVLSKRIKVERDNLEPLIKIAVVQAIALATDPVSYYQSEIEKAPEGKINEYLKENKKYYKWHDRVITFLIDKAGFGHDKTEYLRAIGANYQVIKESLESENLLLATFGDVKAFNLDFYRIDTDYPDGNTNDSQNKEEESKSSFFDQVEVKQTEEIEVDESNVFKKEEQEPNLAEVKSHSDRNATLNSALLKSRFETESYKGMRGVIGELSESLAINQRFMFTKELFDGNSDLLSHALKSIDDCVNFNEAIQLVNKRYVNELNWEIETEPVQEFLLLIYRKFDEV